MYKILYLPLGEDILIYKEFKYNVIRTLRPNKSGVGLRTPGNKSKYEKEIREPLHNFKTAYFGSISLADRWIEELLERDSEDRHQMRREYFEIIKV